jgi:hypothetical protein
LKASELILRIDGVLRIFSAVYQLAGLLFGIAPTDWRRTAARRSANALRLPLALGCHNRYSHEVNRLQIGVRFASGFMEAEGARRVPAVRSGRGASALLMDDHTASVDKQLDRSRRPIARAACIFDTRGKARKLRYGLRRQTVYTSGAASVTADLQLQVPVTCLAQCGRPWMPNRTKRTARTPMAMPISRNTVRANSNTAFCTVLDRPSVMLTHLGMRA